MCRIPSASCIFRVPLSYATVLTVVNRVADTVFTLHHSPGRFFAVTEMKLIFAKLIQRYDMSLRPGEAPKEMLIATMAIPETKLQILFKVRG